MKGRKDKEEKEGRDGGGRREGGSVAAGRPRVRRGLARRVRGKQVWQGGKEMQERNIES